MKTGIAFIRGIGMFGKRNYTAKSILSCLKKIENRNIKIVGIYNNDNILFLKSDNIHYATVGKKIEESLEKCFNEKILCDNKSI